MQKYVLSFTAFCLLGLVSQVARAQGPYTIGDHWAQGYAMSQPWHGNFYYLPYGQPTALVVPPTSTMQQTYSWGVSQNVSRPIYHQFGRSAPMGMLAVALWGHHAGQATLTSSASIRCAAPGSKPFRDHIETQEWVAEYSVTHFFLLATPQRLTQVEQALPQPFAWSVPQPGPQPAATNLANALSVTVC